MADGWTEPVPDHFIADDMGSPIDLALVGCGKSKKPFGVWPASELYTGTLFRLAYNYARTYHEDTLILSALHGAIEPTLPLARYNVTTSTMFRSELEQWGHTVVGQLLSLYPLTRLTITFLCGQQYIRPVVAAMRKERPAWDHLAPLEGLDLFERLRWFRSKEDPNAIQKP